MSKNNHEKCSLLMEPFKRLHETNMRKRLIRDDFTLISQNCLGGVIYHMLGLQTKSPTINMYIRGENFVKLARDPQKYMVDPKPFAITETYKEPGMPPHPMIGIEDIRLNCLHYHNCQEAIEAWKRRCSRVDFDRCLVLAMDWDLDYDDTLIERILNLPRPKVLFSYRHPNRTYVAYCDEKTWTPRGREINMPILTNYKHGYKRIFESVFDVVGWINTSLP